MNDEITCPICGKSAGVSARYCGECGFAFESGLMTAGTKPPVDGSTRRRNLPAPVFAGLLAIGGVAASFAAGDCCSCPCGGEKAKPAPKSSGADGVCDFCTEKNTKVPGSRDYKGDTGCGCD
jgi:hypothetical protein